MATARHPISEHDVVVLRQPVGAWPAGTTGAVISDYGDTLLVEITGPGGKTLDMIQATLAQLKIRSLGAQAAAPPDINQIQDHIQARLAEVERLVEPLQLEAERLGEAAAVFEDAGTLATTARRAVRSAGTRTDQALATIAEHPGITVPELARTLGINTSYLYRVLPKLVEAHRINKHGRGYRIR
jgi:exonuclease VII small subunit